MLKNSFRVCGADKLISTYVVFFFISAAVLLIFEPNINHYGDALWFCFASATSIGYGDLVSVTVVGRIVTVILSIYSICVIAVLTAVITSFFMDYAKVRYNESVGKFMDDLEHLPELSKEELEEISVRVREFRKNRNKNKNKD